MSRLRVRISVRWAMVAVALIAVGLAVFTMLLRRREEFRRLSREYGQRSLSEMLLGRHAAFSHSWEPSAEELDTLHAHEGLNDYYWGLKTKYERAASRPWLPVGDDPPPPVWPAGVRRHEL